MDLSWIEPFRLRRLKRAEYDRMVEAGAFEGERVQYIEGMLVEMSPQNAPHANAVDRMDERLEQGIAGRARVRCQLPLDIAAESVPEPDVAVVPNGDYSRAHPTGALLVVEVSDSSLTLDRAKARIYAAGGVPEYWIVNLALRVIEVRDQPGPQGYARLRTFSFGESIAPAAFPDVSVAVASLFS